jgi:hypothetical protein
MQMLPVACLKFLSELRLLTRAVKVWLTRPLVQGWKQKLQCKV